MPHAPDATAMDDEDAYLYGSANGASVEQDNAAQQEVVNASGGASTELTSGAASSEERAVQAAPSEQNESKDEEEDEEEDSDSDVEFIIDPTAPVVPPPRAVSFAPASITTPTKPAQAPAPQAGEASSRSALQTINEKTAAPASVPASALSSTVPAPAPAPESLPASLQEDTILTGPEGPPPSAPITGPDLNLDTRTSGLYYPPSDTLYDARTEAQKAEEPPPMTIYQVDIDSLPEKPWRRPGANLSDWFNYGFDERTWAMWCGKRHNMESAREEMQPVVSAETDAANASAAAGIPLGMPPGLPPGVQDIPGMPDASGSMPDFSALLGGSNGMMNMPPPMPAWSMMQGMVPGAGGGLDVSEPPAMPMPMPMPPMLADAHGMWQDMTRPTATDGSGEGPMPASGEAVDDEEPYEPNDNLPPPSRSDNARSGRRHHGLSNRGDSRRVGGNDRRRNHDFDDAHSPRYNDRDMVQHAGDTLDYGAHAEDVRRVRRSPGVPDDHDSEHSGRHGSQRDRPSRRERERARHDRRSGRGGQKRGAPDAHDDGREYASKRAHHGPRSRRDNT